MFESEESKRRYDVFISVWHKSIDSYYQKYKSKIIDGRRQYPSETKERNRLQQAIIEALTKNPFQIPEVWTQVEKWGWPKSEPQVERLNPQQHIVEVTRKAFDYLHKGMVREAANCLIKEPKLRGVRIARASKMLALSDLDLYGVYDSRVANRLRPIAHSTGKPVIPVPFPFGGKIQGTYGDKALGFENFTWILRYMLPLFRAEPGCANWKVSDVELGLYGWSKKVDC